MDNKKLYRSETNKMVAGVCGGLGEYFNIDPTLIRLIWAVLTVFTVIFGGIVLYILATIIIPSEYQIRGE